jgi:hypothetical protein
VAGDVFYRGAAPFDWRCLRLSASSQPLVELAMMTRFLPEILSSENPSLRNHPWYNAVILKPCRGSDKQKIREA